MKSYINFLEDKIIVSENYGFESDKPIGNLLDHHVPITQWCLQGGRRAIFASFGLGKTCMQLEIAYQCIRKTGKPFLIALPLGVIGEFKRDNHQFFNDELSLKYITDTDSIDEAETAIYLTNYERIRKGDIDPDMFCGVSFDEASILRSLSSQTTDYVLTHFKSVPYRFVATATPTPNDLIEILNYADFLGVIDRGYALTRFFQRDSQKAGNLTLYPNKKEEFWKWVATWAVFINKPSDLGFSDEGYDLPELNIIEHEVDNTPAGLVLNKNGEAVLFRDTTKSLIDTAREKRETIEKRVQKAFEVYDGFRRPCILWHHLDAERDEIKRVFSGLPFQLQTVTGSQKNSEKEQVLIDFSNGEFDLLSTKDEIAGSGCNFQHACYDMIFVGINYKFNNFIQAIHRCHRFKQANRVNVHIIFTSNEREVLKELYRKWKQHMDQQETMINLVREFGLNSDKVKADMKRQLFNGRRSESVAGTITVNNDSVIEWQNLPDNCHDMVLTSIPFGDHYEYSDNYNDMGHNNGNDAFFDQLDYLIPNLHRCIKPGRIAAIHVKDRIRYSYQTGSGFTTNSDFSGQTVRAFEKHGFWLVGRITITTDVVRENGQTNRLTWKEQRKDATTKGVGLPEYVLLFRKAPSENDNAYADDPVVKQIDEYLLSLWQLDAHSYWKSSGNRLLSVDELAAMELSSIMAWWEKYDKEAIYSFQEHLRLCEGLAAADKLSKKFMTLPPHSSNDLVWTDINRMNTLNLNQQNRKKEKHICPLQLDIIERLIYRFTNEGEVVADPFGGIASTGYIAMKKKRKAFLCELKPAYFEDGLFYLKSIEYKMSVPTLFDFV